MVSVSEFVSEDKGLFKVLVNSFMPATAVIPLHAESNDVSAIVKVGDHVSEGQVIAVGSDVCVHSSVPGVVSDISIGQYSDGKQGLSMKIKLGGSFTFVGRPKNVHNWQSISADEISLLIKNSGVVNTFKTCVSLNSQITDLRGKSKIITVRLFDDDPSRVCESFISENLSDKIVEGSAVLAKALGAEGVVFIYDKFNAISKKIYSDMNDENSDFYTAVSDIFDNVKFISVSTDGKKYPMGTMHDLISVTKSAAKSMSKKKSDVASIFLDIAEGDLFIDSQTAVSVYDAVVLRMPVISRYVHITGEALNAAAIMNVKIGTSFRQLVEQCGGLKKRLAKIVVNGTLLGYSVGSLDIPVTKMVKSIEFIPDSEVSIEHTDPCIRCGQCRKVCPMNLWPGNIYRTYNMVQTGEFEMDSLTCSVINASKVCIECGLCNSVCPSRIPLRQTIAFAKNFDL